MKPKAVIVDYGVGNLLSVARAFEYCGAEVTVSSSVEKILQADRLVLPGVGAFGDCMRELKERNIHEAIVEFTEKNRPFLGICVGMQVLHEMGEEFGSHEGLGIVAGRVSPLPDKTSTGSPHKIPHVGWSGLYPPEGINNTWKGTILSEIKTGANVYFVHSFEAQPVNPENILACYIFNGHPITAVVRSGNIYGCQFHPEKSGQVGLKIIHRFLEL